MAMSRNRMSDAVASGLLAPYDNWKNRVAIDAFVRDIPLTRGHPTHETLRKLESDLGQIKHLPQLLVWGMKDWCFRPECLRRFEIWPHATVEFLTRATTSWKTRGRDAAIDQFVSPSCERND